MQNAFDKVNRDLLMLRLLHYNIDGDICTCRSVQSLYRYTDTCVRVNEMYTDFFNVETGVRQGDNLSPTLFGLFVNDLAIEIKSLGCGIKFGHDQVSLLLYADDIVFLADSECNLEKMFDQMRNWCSRWRLKVQSYSLQKKREVRAPLFNLLMAMK